MDINQYLIEFVSYLSVLIAYFFNQSYTIFWQKCCTFTSILFSRHCENLQVAILTNSKKIKKKQNFGEAVLNITF